MLRTVRLGIWVTNSDEAQLLNLSQENVIGGIGIDFKKYQKVRNFGVMDLIFVGRLTRDKGFNDFIKVILSNKDFLLKEKIAVRIFGDVAPNSPSSLSSSDLKKIAVENQRILQFNGFIVEPFSQIDNFSILVFPSVREGFPVAVMEASYKGIPTVGFKVPGVVDAVKHDLNGQLVDDLDEMWGFIASVFHLSKLERIKLSDKCVSYAVKNFDRKNYVRFILKLVSKSQS